MKEELIYITRHKGCIPSKANGKKSLFPIYDELCDPRVDSQEYIEMISELWKQLKPKKCDGSRLKNGNIIVTGTPS